MSWLTERPIPQETLANQLLERIQEEAIAQIPGVHDSMTALIARKTGFELLYLSGAAYTASRGLPDLGMIHSHEVAERARDIVRATQMPLLVDIDTGYGGVLDVARAAREMVEAGVAAVQIEDQNLPKKCGHLNGKQLISAEEMVQKIRMIKEVAPTLAVIARTDANAVEGFEKAMVRARAYREAGADGIFPEALSSESDFEQAGKTLSGIPLLANMTEFGRTPYYHASQFESWGFQMVIYPVTSLRAASKAIERIFEEIRDQGTQKGKINDMQTREELYNTISYYEYEALDEEIAKTVLPETEKNKNF